MKLLLLEDEALLAESLVECLRDSVTVSTWPHH